MNNIFKYTLLVLLAIILIPGMLLLGLFSTLKFDVLNAQTYLTVLDKEHGYLQLQDVVLDALQKQFNPAALSTSEVPPDLLNDIKQKVLTEEYLKSQLQPVIINFFDYLNSRQDSLELKIQVSPLKAPLKEALQLQIPPSTPELERRLAEQQIDAMISQIPDLYDAKTVMPKDMMQRLDEVRTDIQAFNVAFYILIAVLVALFLLSYLVTSHFYGWLRFISIIFFTGGLLLLISVIIVAPLSENMLAFAGSPGMHALAVKLLNHLLDFPLMFSVALLVVGIVSFVASFFIKKTPQQVIHRMKGKKVGKHKKPGKKT